MGQVLRYVDKPEPVSFQASNVSVADNELHANSSFYQIKYQVFNGLPNQVTVVDRHGVRLRIPSVLAQNQNSLVVRLIVQTSRNVIIDTDDLLHSSSKTTRAVGETIRDGFYKTRYGQNVYSLDFHITPKDLNAHGGSLYLSNLDLVVSIADDPYVPYHPYSDKGIRNKMVQDEPTINRVDSFGLGIRIFDSAERFGKRYINVHGLVYPIPVIRDDPDTPDGVYLISSGPVDGDYAFSKPISERYDFDEADEALGLFNTAQQAKTHGNELANREKEIEEEKVRLKERMSEVRREEEVRRQENEEWKLANEREREKLDHERKMQERAQKIEDQQMEADFKHFKHHYDRRAMERKETHEIIKYIPTIISGCLAIAIAMMKLKADK